MAEWRGQVPCSDSHAAAAIWAAAGSVTAEFSAVRFCKGGVAGAGAHGGRQKFVLSCSAREAWRAQVRMVDGAIVVDAGTLTVQAQEADAAPRVVVSGSDQLLNSHSYAANRTPGDKWSSEETENFYNVCAPMRIPALNGHARSRPPT